MEKIDLKVGEWKNSNVKVFWGEIAPCDHVVQIYEDDKCFLDTLEGFCGNGLLSGDSVVIIATQEHLNNLNERLLKQGFDLEKLMSIDQYIPLVAEETLAKFMVNNWPDEKLFNECISGVIERATANDRKVRAFGEMVALLWVQGLNGATVQLENLWNQLHSNEQFSLYCAYPKSGFTQSAADSIDKICQTHSKVIDGQAHPATEIYFRTVK
jgi:hypothetical protein